VIGRALWTAGAPVRAVLIGFIRGYRAILSGWLGGQCRFYPTCSHYAEEAIRTQGALRGSALAVWRVLRCNPFGKGGPEPAPSSRQPGPARRSTYEPVIHPTGPGGTGS
jgi:putative membrane protein insertion efficiency factor